MRSVFLLAAAALAAPITFVQPALAAPPPPPPKFSDPVTLSDEFTLDPIIDGRLRWESVDQPATDAGGIDYGNEWNASLGFKLARGASLLAKYADYNAKGFGVDTRIFWLQGEFTF